MTTTSRTHSRPRHRAAALTVTTPLPLLVAGTSPAYADPHDTPVPPFPDPIIADFSPLQPPGVDSPAAALLPGPVIADVVPPPSQVVEIILGPDNPASRDYTGLPVPTLPNIPLLPSH